MRDSLVPIATKYDVPFCLGIITSKLDAPGFIGTKDLENFSRNPLMTISSHSIHHTDNSKLDEKEETKEMCDSREMLMKLSEQKVETYIYPS
jgi:peptidoglycan/xylan/chitin deacetylase (PgdA/CDA1 family)